VVVDVSNSPSFEDAAVLEAALREARSGRTSSKRRSPASTTT
jgi:hypothetical protein